MTTFSGLDGDLEVTDTELIFRRGRISAAGRSVSREHRVRLDRVRAVGLGGGRSGDKALVVEVVGYDVTGGTGDPHAVTLKRNQLEPARAFAQALTARLPGVVDVDEPPLVVEPAAAATPTQPQVVMHSAYTSEEDRQMSRMIRLAEWSTILLLLIIGLPILVAVVALVIALFIILL